jgi:hypothetical protein
LKCYVCGNPIHFKRTFLNLFEPLTHQICHRCYRIRENIYPYFVIPSQGGLIHIFEALTEIDGPSYIYFSHLAHYFNAYIRVRPSIKLIYLDELNDSLLELFQQLNIDLIILTLKYKEE